MSINNYVVSWDACVRVAIVCMKSCRRQVKRELYHFDEDELSYSALHSQ